jgi:hypothetical protein
MLIAAGTTLESAAEGEECNACNGAGSLEGSDVDDMMMTVSRFE